MTIGASISRHARSNPCGTALIFEGEKLQWQTFDLLVRKLGKLIGQQVGTNGGAAKAIALDLPNCPALPLLFFAIVRQGLECQILDPDWPQTTRSLVLRDLQPAGVIGTGDRTFISNSTAMPLEKLSFQDMEAALAGADAIDRFPEVDQETPFYTGFTSGSTGIPKGYRRHHRSWIESFKADGKEFRLSIEDVVCAPGAMSHSLFLYALVRAVHAGSATVYLRQFRPDKVLHMAASHAASILYGVPAHFAMLVRQSALSRSAPLDSIKQIISSGSKWTDSIRPAMERLCPGATISEFYGASELSFVSLARHDEPVPPGSVGRAFAGVRITIRDQDGEALPPGETGQVFVESPMTFLHYATGSAGDVDRIGDALSVGDMGYLDSEGFLFLTGRKSRMIVSAGKNLYPEEIEAVLAVYPHVLSCAVLAGRDALRGERPVAFVKCDERIAESASLIAHCRRYLPLYKVPRHYFRVDEWPSTRSGKTDLSRLQELHLAGAYEALS